MSKMIQDHHWWKVIWDYWKPMSNAGNKFLYCDRVKKSRDLYDLEKQFKNDIEGLKVVDHLYKLLTTHEREFYVSLEKNNY